MRYLKQFWNWVKSLFHITPDNLEDHYQHFENQKADKSPRLDWWEHY